MTLTDAKLDEIEADLHNRPLIVLEVDVTHLIAALRASREILRYIDSVAPEIRDSCNDDEHAEIVVTIKALRDLRAALGEEAPHVA